MASDGSPFAWYQALARRCSVRHELRQLVGQARAQDVGEEVVIAVPAAPVVERDQEQVPPLQRVQHGLAIAALGHGVAQRAAQPVQDRGLQQEAPNLVGLPVQDLLDQVVDDVAVVPREPGDEAGDVVAPLHRQRRQLEGGDPPFGAPLEGLDVARRQCQAHDVVQVRGSLGRREAQVRGADLDELAARPQAAERQRRIGTRGDHEMDAWRQVLQQERHPVPMSWASTTWSSSSTSTRSFGNVPSSLSSVARIDSIGGGWDPCRRARAVVPTSGAAVRRAVIR